MLTGLLTDSQAQAQVTAGNGETLWGLWWWASTKLKRQGLGNSGRPWLVHCLALCVPAALSHHSLLPGYTRLFPACCSILYLPFSLPRRLNISCPTWEAPSYLSFKSPLGGSPPTILQHGWGFPINTWPLPFPAHITRLQLLTKVKNELQQHLNQGNNWETWFRIYSFKIFNNIYNS